MLLIGLTGGIGAGKSSVSAGLAERGAVVVDADAIVRELQRPGTVVFDEMVARFHLDALGVRLTKLTPEQSSYLGIPVEGPYKPAHYRY